MLFMCWPWLIILNRLEWEMSRRNPDTLIGWSKPNTVIQLEMEVGQKVKVRRIRDRVSDDVVSKIKQNPVGTISDYKMVDGSGIGAVVQFEGGFSTWFFEDELELLA